MNLSDLVTFMGVGVLVNLAPGADVAFAMSCGPLRVIYPHSAVIADDLARSMAIWVKTTAKQFEE